MTNIDLKNSYSISSFEDSKHISVDGNTSLTFHLSKNKEYNYHSLSLELHSRINSDFTSTINLSKIDEDGCDLIINTLVQIKKDMLNSQQQKIIEIQEKVISNIPESPVVPSGFQVKFTPASVIDFKSAELLKDSDQLIYVEDNEMRFTSCLEYLDEDLHIDAVDAVLHAYKYEQRPIHADDANLKPWELEAIKAGWIPPTK